MTSRISASPQCILILLQITYTALFCIVEGCLCHSLFQLQWW